MVGIEVPVDCPHCQAKLKVRIPQQPAAPPPEQPISVEPPAPPALDLGKLAERLGGVEAKLKVVPEDFCTTFPDLCRGVNEIKSRLDQKDEEDAHAHFAPSDELFEHWDSCPECKGKADELAKRLAARVKASEKAKEEPPPAPPAKPEEKVPLPEKEETPAPAPEPEYIPPWKR